MMASVGMDAQLGEFFAADINERGLSVPCGGL